MSQESAPANSPEAPDRRGSAFSRFWVSLVPQWVHPNHLTFMRLGITTLMLIIDLNGGGIGWAFCLGFIAGFSDLFDGAVARVRGLESKLGAFLDPLGDKYLAVVGCYIVWNHDLVPLWLLLLFLLTEVHSVAIPLMMIYDRMKNDLPWRPVPKVRPNRWGKLKTGWLASSVGLTMLGAWLDSSGTVAFARYNIHFALFLGLVGEVLYFRSYSRGDFEVKQDSGD
jgi:phosphatidylglycerophosphate synthase